MKPTAVDMPEVETLLRRIHTVELRINRLLDTGLTGAYRSVFHGLGVEAEGLREYTFEDDAALIDWQASARTRRPHVRVYREERELVCLLLVDVSASMRCRAPGLAARGAAADMAALLALAAVHNRDRVGLLLFSTQTELWLPPSRSRAHALRLIREVACHEPTAEGTDIGQALLLADRLVPRRSLVFLISDMASDVAAADVVRLTRRHELITLHLAPCRPVELPRANALWVQAAETGECLPVCPSSEAVRHAYRAAARRNLASTRAAVCRGGAEWVTVPADASALATLARFLTRRARAACRTHLGLTEATG